MDTKSGPPPNYYAILEVPENATQAQIRNAYKRAALKCHPDRLPANHPDRPQMTRRFQLVNDAYYTLYDPDRRREYDAQRHLWSKSSSSYARSTSQTKPSATYDPFSEAEANAPPHPGESFFSWAFNFFNGRSRTSSEYGDDPETARQKAEDAQFADVFEEMLREEGISEEDLAKDANKQGGGSSLWSIIGTISGGALGFIVANGPGMIAGAAAGNRLGAVRDAKGKSVWEVYQDLPPESKAKLLSMLAVRVLSHAAGI